MYCASLTGRGIKKERCLVAISVPDIGMVAEVHRGEAGFGERIY